MTEQIVKLLREVTLALEERGVDGPWLYFIQAADNGPIKIGFASSPETRRNDLQSGNHLLLRLLVAVPGGRRAEELAHAAFVASRIRGEWFRAEPSLLELIRRLDAIMSAEAA